MRGRGRRAEEPTSRRGDDSKVISPGVTSADERAFYRGANEAVRADFAALGFALHHIDDKETGIARSKKERERKRERKTGRPRASPPK